MRIRNGRAGRIQLRKEKECSALAYCCDEYNQHFPVKEAHPSYPFQAASIRVAAQMLGTNRGTVIAALRAFVRLHGLPYTDRMQVRIGSKGVVISSQNVVST